MPITTSDIEHKTFSTALRGYDLDEVDDFLDEIVVALRDLHGELTAAKAKIAELEQSKGTDGVGADEASVGRVLILAQQAADRTADEARTEADRLLEDARAEADRTLSEARTEADRTLTEARTEADSFEADREQRRDAAETEMGELSVLVASVRNQLALLATTVADKLDEMDSTIDSAGLEATTEDIGYPEADSEEDSDMDVAGVEDESVGMTGDLEMAEGTGDAGSEVGESAELDLDTIQLDEIAADEDIDVDSETETTDLEAEAGSEDEGDDSDEGDDEEPETSD